MHQEICWVFNTYDLIQSSQSFMSQAVFSPVSYGKGGLAWSNIHMVTQLGTGVRPGLRL